MNLEATHSFFQSLVSDNLCFGYQGTFNDDITNRVIDLSEENINIRGELVPMKNKVSFLMAECFQNIVRHGESTAKSDKIPLIKTAVAGTGIFLTRNIGDTFIIASANKVTIEEIPTLKDKLEKVNALDKDELRELYLDILKNEGLSRKGGAGLGLVEMARKSGQKLQFHFEEIDSKHAYFYLQINLKKSRKSEYVIIPISFAKEFHNQMEETNILMIHKGNYSQDSIMPILKMIEDNLKSQSERTFRKKRVFHVLVEILQNISIHSLEEDGIRQGIFMIGKKGEQYSISAGNYIKNENIENFKKQLQKVSILERTELKTMYIDKLKEERIEMVNCAGLGLIDIGRESSAKIVYDFFPVNDEKSFFVIGVLV